MWGSTSLMLLVAISSLVAEDREESIMERILNSWQSLSVVPISPEWNAASRLKNPLFFRNITELTQVITNAAFYFKNFYALAQNASTVRYLEDHPDCGIRNNDTFGVGPDPRQGGQATADWSVECLWDCEWKENPYFRQKRLYTDPRNNTLQINITLTMPKVPVDLRCLHECTDTEFPVLFDDLQGGTPVDCGQYPFGSFLGCYLYYRFRGPRPADFYSSPPDENASFYSQSYFDLAVESCVLAYLEPSLYPDGDCTTRGVNLRIFNPYLKEPYLATSVLNATKLLGAGTQEVVEFGGTTLNDRPRQNRYPWLCSLRNTGYRGAHRCGVTLISGRPLPTIFVSAAHCNSVCKDSQGRLVELCCCRSADSQFNCRDSDFCGSGSTLQPAAAKDLQIVCNLPSQEPLPQGLDYPSGFIVIEILEIVNHPNYLPLAEGAPYRGPIGGSDISVYKVNDTNLNLDQKRVWPACLPRPDDRAYVAGNQGILAGWIEPVPTYVLSGYDTSLKRYINSNLVQREELLRGEASCRDPAWMRSNTYYPAGTVCYTHPAWAGSVQFGASGSGLVRPFTTGNNAEVRYSWVGPLSMSKGNDQSIFFPNSATFVELSSNPAVFTDGRCYLDWIAAQFGLTLPTSYTKPASCSSPTGDKTAANNTNCLSRAITSEVTTNMPEMCNFETSSQKRCTLFFYTPSRPGFNQNVYYCTNAKNELAICANDCVGVDPNAVVVGGEVALLSLAAAAAVGPDLLGPLLGLGVGVAGLGLGGAAMNSQCPRGQCRATQSGQCCDLIRDNGRRRCPIRC